MTIPRLDRMDKNYLINGGFDFSQRFPGVSIAPTSLAYRPDRWLFQRLGNWDGGFEPSFQRHSADTPSVKSEYSARFDTMKATDATAAIVLQQRMESIFTRELANQPVSISLKYKGTNFQNLELKLDTADVKDDHSATTNFFTQEVTLNDDGAQWRELKFENITVPSSGVNGIKFNIQVKDPDTFSTEFDWHIGEIKLNIGKQVQDFSLAGRDLNEELQKCQRHCCKSFDLETAPGTNTDAGALYRKGDIHPFSFPVTMMGTPTITAYSPSTGASGFGHDITSAADRAATPTREGQYGAAIILASTADTATSTVHFLAVSEL